jgi:hypothetical protein
MVLFMSNHKHSNRNWHTKNQFDLQKDARIGSISQLAFKNSIESWKLNNNFILVNQLYRKSEPYYVKGRKRLQRWAYQYPPTSALYGFTKNESTGQYLLVLRYFPSGDLRKQLQHQATDWKGKIHMIIELLVIWTLFTIHEAGMIHR